MRIRYAVAAAGLLATSLGVSPAHAQVAGTYEWLCFGTQLECDTATAVGTSAASAADALAAVQAATDLATALPVDESVTQSLTSGLTGGLDTTAASYQHRENPPQRTGTGYGYKTSPSSAGDYYGWRLSTISFKNPYYKCRSDRSCAHVGSVGINASFNLSGRGTGALVMNMFVIDGPSVYPAFRIICRETSGVGSNCGGRYKGTTTAIPPGSNIDYSYNFAANGEGYKFQDAALYDLSFSFLIDPISDSFPSGQIQTRAWDSDEINCPSGNGNCVMA